MGIRNFPQAVQARSEDLAGQAVQYAAERAAFGRQVTRTRALFVVRSLMAAAGHSSYGCNVPHLADALLGIYATTVGATGVFIEERCGSWLVRRTSAESSVFVIPTSGFGLEQALEMARKMIAAA